MSARGQMVLGLVAACSFAGSSSLGCSPTPAPVSRRESPQAEEPARARPELPPGKSVSFDAELHEVERLRQLSIERPVLGRTIGTAALRRHLTESFQRDVPAEVREGSGDLFVALGLAPLDFDFEQTMLSLLESDLAGLYDPRLGAMFLREELEGEAKRATLLHELVHALQDQHYDLESLTDYGDDSSDRVSAVSSLAEGDAMSGMLDGLLASTGKTSLDLPDDAWFQQFQASAAAAPGGDIPPIIRRSVLSPYIDGLAFVQRLRRRGGFAEVDRVWAQPPRTTEQILHLEKYDAGELGRVVPIPEGPLVSGDPFVTSFHDIEGEQSLRLWLEEWMSHAEAAEAASGWGGDRLAIFARGDQRALSWVLQSDDAAHATTLFRAIARAAPRAPKQARDAASPICFLRPDRGPFAAAVRGDRVVVVAGPYAKGGGPALSDCAAAGAWLARLLGPVGSGAPARE